MKYLLGIAFLNLFILSLEAQENNPLINSGELIEQAISLHDSKKYADAIALYQKIPRGDTNYYKALYEMTLSQMLDSQYVAAKNTCEKALAVTNDKWPDLMTLYGNLIDDMGDSERALRVYDSAIHLFPAFSELYLNKGTTLLKMNRYSDAEDVLKLCVLINPYQGSAHYKLGYSAMQQGKIIEAFLSFVNYLLLQPEGTYKVNSINSLSAISKATDEVKELISKRKEGVSDHFQLQQRILISKIALEKQYKPLLKLDDPIIRQIQVLFEKLEYDENSNDFWMQYYVPFFKKIFSENKFEPFVYRLFANLNIDIIKDYVKKNKKKVEDIVDEAVSYSNQIRYTRELNYAARKDMKALYQFSNGELFGKGATSNNGEILTGDWEFYFPSGNIRSKGLYNEKGEKKGFWQYYFFDGSERGNQTLKDDKLEGKEVFYYDNKSISSVASYQNDLEEGESRFNYRTGVLRIIAPYKNGKLDGERKAFYTNGVLQAIENYKEGALDGAFKTFHKTGPLESVGSYKMGELDGEYKSFFADGKLSIEGNYTAGKLFGPLKQYHENGKLKIQETFVDGLLEGEYIEYYDNGQIFSTTFYKKGKVTGDVNYFDTDGKKFFIYTLDNDILKTAAYFDKAGKIIGTSDRKAKRLDLTTYYSDGFKRSQAVYNDKAEIEGKEVYYYRSGKPSSAINYEKGVQQGESIYYYPNGKVHATSTYKDGEKHGYEKYWFTHGQLQEEGWHQDGMLQGIWLTYDELGNLLYKSEYLNNDINGYKEEFFPNGIKNNETRYNNGWMEEFIQYDTTGKEINRCKINNGITKFKVVFFNGKTFGEGTYVDGELDGLYQFYYFDGTVNTRQFYKKGDLDSLFQNYYHGGKLSQEGRYKLGKKDGEWKNYFNNGKLNFKEQYLNGELTGKKTYYYENGKPDTEIEMDKGERHGWTKKFDEDGSLLYQVRFIKDLPIAYTYLDKTSKLVPEINIPGGSGVIKSYFSNGKQSADFAYADGKLHGSNILYFPNGQIRSQSIEDYSLTEGSYKYYFSSGKVKNEYYFLHNNLHGAYKEYNEKGIVIEEGEYFNDQPHNILKKYDDSGILNETRIYYYGKLLDIKK